MHKHICKQIRHRTTLRRGTTAAAIAIVALSAGCSGSTGDPGGGGTATTTEPPDPQFSFFVASYRALQDLSGSESGFGGDLRFGETGPGAGLRGADKICATIAEKSLPGAGALKWRAFLSASAGEDGNQVNAIDRIGEGPWYDRLGRVFALSKADLLADRPLGIDETIRLDFPNEDGIPNHQPDPTQPEVDNHDTLTGSNAKGMLYDKDATCLDWTSAKGDLATEGKPRVGHSWTRQHGDGGEGGHIVIGMGGGPMGMGGGPMGMGGGPGMNMGGGPMGMGGGPIMMSGGGPEPDDNMDNWMSALTESGCAPGVNLIEMGPPKADAVTVGSGGGYGGFYCFAILQ